MLLRNSIAKTKKFFHKTLESFKSMLSGGYERLPKTPPFNPFSCGGGSEAKLHQSFRELDNFYTDFTNRWDSDDGKAKKRNKKKFMSKKEPSEEEDSCNGSFMMFAKQNPAKSRREEKRDDEKKMRSIHKGESYSQSEREGEGYLVAQRLKEMVMLDVSNMDHVLDIEEVLHYYSRLRCPAYLDMVDKFFMEIYSEFFLPQTSSVDNNSLQSTQLLNS